MKRKMLLAALLVILALALTGCLPGDGSNDPNHLAGIFSGVWHGWIAPFSLIVSIFNSSIGIYEVHNNGFLYDLGFYAAIISGFGGLSLVRNKLRK